MVDLGPLDADALRALLDAAKLGRSLLKNNADSSVVAREAAETDEAAKNNPTGNPSVSDINNPSIDSSGVIGSLNFTTVYVSVPESSVETAGHRCCFEYPEGKCPHRS